MAKKKALKKDYSKIIISIIVVLAIVFTGVFYLTVNKAEDENKVNLSNSNQNINTIIDDSSSEEFISIEIIDEEEISTLEVDKIREHLSDVTEGSLSDAELAGLYYMEEEEKLAHDIYVALGEMWNIKSFQNISKAEASHASSTAAVLEAYGYPSIQSSELGLFENQELQNLYNALLDDGSVSSQEAILVGIMVEEVDIVDLDKFLAETDNADIITLYNNLKRGSENHLRAFVKNYERSGDSYFPQFLDESYYNSVIAR